MQVYTRVSHIVSAWKRSLTGWFSQQYQLYLWSVYAGARDMYWRSVRYPGVLLLSIVGYMSIVLLCGYITSMAMIVTAVSMLGARSTMLNPAWHLRIPDMYSALRSWGTAIVAPYSDEVHPELRGHALDIFVISLLLHVCVWGVWQYVVTSVWPECSADWRVFVYLQPVLIMINFFLLDAGMRWRSLPWSIYRAGRLIWYNLPLCVIITALCWAWRYSMMYIPYGWCIEIATVPVWISVWYTIYMKSIYEQFARYYGDIFTCQADTT